MNFKVEVTSTVDKLAIKRIRTRINRLKAKLKKLDGTTLRDNWMAKTNAKLFLTTHNELDKESIKLEEELCAEAFKVKIFNKFSNSTNDFETFYPILSEMNFYCSPYGREFSLVETPKLKQHYVDLNNSVQFITLKNNKYLLICMYLGLNFCCHIEKDENGKINTKLFIEQQD